MCAPLVDSPPALEHFRMRACVLVLFPILLRGAMALFPIPALVTLKVLSTIGELILNIIFNSNNSLPV